MVCPALHRSMDYKAIGENFVKFYYETFDSGRANLSLLYTNDSMMTFEGSEFKGNEAIMKKLNELPIQVVQHVLTTCDCQPTGNAVTIHVIGQQKCDNDPPISFSQTFVLAPTPEGSFFVMNDIFRLGIHNM